MQIKSIENLAQLSKPNRECFSAQRLQLPAEPASFSFNQVQTNWDSCTKKAVGRSVRQKAQNTQIAVGTTSTNQTGDTNIRKRLISDADTVGEKGINNQERTRHG